ncbi:hypothetical protein FG93_05272 [Bosea sp. LC85]|uniref:hypothetical protein n=1 Tax=Bosea sp. LC85 TaxID=1502851 RepID=UPI0004E33A17|nr:hypothetical protein [Bosea sp. LC85]KFC64676.1 hypothetical protein FG93_05272 [Bosea sp. LC85]
MRRPSSRGNFHSFNPPGLPAQREQLGAYPDARQRYERALTLGDAEARAGNHIEAERHYQQAEHYLRSIHSRAA